MIPAARQNIAVSEGHPIPEWCNSTFGLYQTNRTRRGLRLLCSIRLELLGMSYAERNEVVRLWGVDCLCIDEYVRMNYIHADSVTDATIQYLGYLTN